jgi:hypothetical protein
MTQELNAAMEDLDAPVSRAKAVHRCRVHLKRARALGKVGQAVAPGLAAVFDDSARMVMRQLTESRDLAAHADAARMLAETANRKGAAPLLKAADALAAERDALPEVDFDGIRAGIRDLLALGQVWPEPSLRQIRSGARRITKRAQRARRRGFATADETPRHRWRKREQDRLYAAKLLGKSWGAPRRRKEAAALTYLLGTERDVLLLMQRLEANPSLAGGEAAIAQVRRVVRKHVKRLRKRADKLGERFSVEGV